MIRSAYFAAIADFCKQTFATQNFLMSQIFANIAILSKRKCGRVVECTGLENRRRLTPFVSSNLTASANSIYSFTSPFFWRKPPWPEISGPSLFLSPIQDWRSLCPMDISVPLRPRHGRQSRRRQRLSLSRLRTLSSRGLRASKLSVLKLCQQNKAADISASGRSHLESAEIFVLRENDVVKEVDQHGCSGNTHHNFQNFLEFFVIHRCLSLLGGSGGEFLHDSGDTLDELVSFASCDIQRRHDADDVSCGH